MLLRMSLTFCEMEIIGSYECGKLTLSPPYREPFFGAAQLHGLIQTPHRIPLTKRAWAYLGLPPSSTKHPPTPLGKPSPRSSPISPKIAHGGDLTRKVRMAPQTLSLKSRTATRTKIIEESMPDWDLYGFQPQLAQSSYGEVLGSL